MTLDLHQYIPGWGFVAPGVPAPQGSMRGFVAPSKNGGRPRAIITADNSKTKPWRQNIIDAIKPGWPRLDGPIAVKMVFTMPRPKSAKRTETTPTTIPDLDKLVRAASDAIKDAGLWQDDSRVANLTASKVWSGFQARALDVPGLLIAAVEMRWGWQEVLRAYEYDAYVRWMDRNNVDPDPIRIVSNTSEGEAT